MLNSIRNYFRYSSYPRKLLYKSLKTLDSIPLYEAIYTRHIEKRALNIGKFPPELSVETTNLCNARCTICAHPNMKRAKGFMETSLVNSLIEQAASNSVGKLFLSGFGEPLLDKRLPQFVAEAKRQGVRNISIVTNGYLLDRSIVDELLQGGLNEIIISVDGFTSQSYEKTRIGLKFNKLADNIRKLPKPENRPGVRIIVSCVDLIRNRNERKIAREVFGDYVDQVYFRQAQGWSEHYGESIAAWTPHFRPNKIPCRYLWDSMSVYIDGTAPVCCLDYEAKGNVGNAMKHSLAEIWTGGKLNGYRQRHLENRKGELEPCKGCGYYSVWW